MTASYANFVLKGSEIGPGESLTFSCSNHLNYDGTVKQLTQQRQSNMSAFLQEDIIKLGKRPSTLSILLASMLADVCMCQHKVYLNKKTCIFKGAHLLRSAYF
jgi:hypothetical protein